MIKRSPSYHLGRIAVVESLCDLELDNHRRVVRLLLKALAGDVPSLARVQAAKEIKERRDLIEVLLRTKALGQDRRCVYRKFV